MIVIKTIQIEQSDDGLWTVTIAGSSASRLAYEEMLGMVVSLTLTREEERPCLMWLTQDLSVYPTA